MITDGVISFLFDFLEAVAGLLPEHTSTLLPGTNVTVPEQFATLLGAYLGALNLFVPVTEIGIVAGVALALHVARFAGWLMMAAYTKIPGKGT